MTAIQLNAELYRAMGEIADNEKLLAKVLAHVAAKMNEVGKDRCFITQIVVAELLFGAYKSKCIEEKED